MLYRIQETALTISSGTVVVLPNASVLVSDTQGEPTTVYSDAAGNNATTNPVTADSDGNYDFYVAYDEYYDLLISKGGASVDKRIYPNSISTGLDTYTIEGDQPTLIWDETDGGASARGFLAGSNLIFQSDGRIRFAATGGGDLTGLDVQSDGAWQEIWHDDNTDHVPTIDTAAGAVGAILYAVNLTGSTLNDDDTAAGANIRAARYNTTTSAFVQATGVEVGTWKAKQVIPDDSIGIMQRVL